MWVEDSDIKICSLKLTAAESISHNVKMSAILSVRFCTSQHLHIEWLKLMILLCLLEG